MDKEMGIGDLDRLERLGGMCFGVSRETPKHAPYHGVSTTLPYKVPALPSVFSSSS
jgi:hypothetical protein